MPIDKEKIEKEEKIKKHQLFPPDGRLVLRLEYTRYKQQMCECVRTRLCKRVRVV